MTHSQTPKQAKILALILEEVELFLEQGILPASTTQTPEESEIPAPPADTAPPTPETPAMPSSDPLADMPGIEGGDDSMPPGMGGMEDLDPTNAMDDSGEDLGSEDSLNSDPIEDLIGNLSTQTVTDVKKTLIADLQAGDKRKQAEDLIAQAKSGDEDIPFNVKQAVGEIEKTFRFTFPAKSKEEEVGGEDALMEASLKTYLNQTFSKKGK